MPWNLDKVIIQKCYKVNSKMLNQIVQIHLEFKQRIKDQLHFPK